jgi:hypothetical protein
VLSSFLLLVFLVVVCFLVLVAGAAGLAVEAARRGLPEEQRRGVSIFPVIPVYPLAFWGVAMLIDWLADPWGTRVVGGLHAVLAVWCVVSIAQNTWRLRSLSKGA